MKREHQERAVRLLTEALKDGRVERCDELHWNIRSLLDEIGSDGKASKEEAPEFDGVTYDPSLDKMRLATLLGRVFNQMMDGNWRPLWQIGTGEASESSIGARLRDLRKPRFGSYRVERRRINDSHLGRSVAFEYRLLSPTGEKIKSA